MVNVLSAVLVLGLFGFSCGQSDHTAYLYDGYGGTGVSVAVNNYVDNLQLSNFNDLASSICVVKGIWLLYQDPTYNTFQPAASGFYWGENFCENLPAELNNLVSSVRYGGSPFNFKDDAINIYLGDWFQSYEVFATNDQSSLSAYGGSLIVTGTSTWTLYDSPNYTGYHVCVTSADMTFAHPGFYPQAADFGFSGRTVRSVRKGCWSNRKISPSLVSKPGQLYLSRNIK